MNAWFIVLSIIFLIIAIIFIFLAGKLYIFSIVLFIVWVIILFALYISETNRKIDLEREEMYRKEKVQREQEKLRKRRESTAHYIHTQSTVEALKVLKIKYVNGEISRERYDKLKKELERLE